ncbi:MAG: F0F1 ATP synthase subunit B [Elusimicrobia bacterium]|nr:F0F1 ATP synthase subunit B [Elusimicrobiota bacterium]
MERLLQPDTGLMVWTIVTFLLLVAVLTKAAWKPILDGINGREKKIREDIERAEKANADAQALRQQYEARLAEAQRAIQDMVSQARQDGERTRSELLTAAKAEAERIIEKGRRELAGETDKLRDELRAEVSALSLAMAEKILNRALDQKTAQDVLKDAVKSMSEAKR